MDSGTLQKSRRKKISPTKRERTRAQLVQAAVEVIAEKGVDANSVTEIANRAGVANGTFYRHFKDRQEIIDVAIFEVASGVAERVESAWGTISEPAERAVRNTRTMMELILVDRIWARALLNCYEVTPKLKEYFAEPMGRTLQDGIDTGVFHARCTTLEIEQVIALVMATVRHLLSPEPKQEPEADTIDNSLEVFLRMLGVSVNEARELTAKTRAGDISQ